jgi:O-glycosyl hydrolase
MNDWVSPSLATPNARELFQGLGDHWCNSSVQTYPETLERFHDVAPDKWLIHT